MKKKIWTLEQLDNKISRIEKKIEKERHNLIDSGFIPNTYEYLDIFWKIKLEYTKDLAPFLSKRNELQPFVEEKREEYNILLNILELDELKKLK